MGVAVKDERIGVPKAIARHRHSVAEISNTTPDLEGMSSLLSRERDVLPGSCGQASHQEVGLEGEHLHLHLLEQDEEDLLSQSLEREHVLDDEDLGVLRNE
jgi:hypothetical protein